MRAFWRAALTDSTRCWQRFVSGLVGFMLSAALLVVAGPYHALVYWLSLTLLLASFALAMSGYAGLFWQRLTRFNSMKKPARRDEP